MSTLIYEKLTYKILRAAFKVHNTIGPGLVESAYEGAFCNEIQEQGIYFERQKVFPVIYNGGYVSSYFADIVVENTVIVECKSVHRFTDVMHVQLINYLKLAKLPVGLLINFANCRVEWKRFINTRGG